MAKNIYIPREIESLLSKTANAFPAVALTGPRQSGKSTLVKRVFEKTHTYISFDDPVMRERVVSDPRLFLDTAGKRIILDEIQYVPELLSYIKMHIDANRQKRGRFIITGSQQFNLIKNLGDSLAGRIGLLQLLPFSITEKDKIDKLKVRLSNSQRHFVFACLQGSFPEVVLDKEVSLDSWYGSYIQTYLERDIRTIYNIGDLRDFQRFMQLLAARSSQILNLSELAREIGVAVNTVKKWISILEACRIIYLLPPYYRNLGKRITKNPKVYFLDCGLICYLTGLKTQEYLLKGPLAGALFENFCIQETIKFLMHHGHRLQLYYMRTHSGLEVDLIIEEAGCLYPFEIKLTKTPKIAMVDSLERFRKTFSKLKIEDSNIIALSEKDIILTKNVTAKGVDSYLESLRDIYRY